MNKKNLVLIAGASMLTLGVPAVSVAQGNGASSRPLGDFPANHGAYQAVEVYHCPDYNVTYSGAGSGLSLDLHQSGDGGKSDLAQPERMRAASASSSASSDVWSDYGKGLDTLRKEAQDEDYKKAFPSPKPSPSPSPTAKSIAGEVLNTPEGHDWIHKHKKRAIAASVVSDYASELGNTIQAEPTDNYRTRLGPNVDPQDPNGTLGY